MTTKEEFMERAKENLEAAELLLNQGWLNTAASRAYYAAFLAASAQLAALGIKGLPLSHKATQATFSREAINRLKYYPQAFHGYLPDLQDKRLTADYGKGVSKKVASRAVAKAQTFVNTIERRL